MKKKKVRPSLVKVKKKETDKGSPIHIQLTSEEFLDSKRDILSYQMELISMLKSLRKYGLIRENEKSAMMNLKNMLKQAHDNMRKIGESFPKVEVPKKFKAEQDAPKKEPTPAIEYYDNDLDSQLEQIRRRLEEIGR